MSKYSLQCGENRTRQHLALEDRMENDGRPSELTTPLPMPNFPCHLLFTSALDNIKVSRVAAPDAQKIVYPIDISMIAWL